MTLKGRIERPDLPQPDWPFSLFICALCAIFICACVYGQRIHHTNPPWALYATGGLFALFALLLLPFSLHGYRWYAVRIGTGWIVVDIKGIHKYQGKLHLFEEDGPNRTTVPVESQVLRIGVGGFNNFTGVEDNKGKYCPTGMWLVRNTSCMQLKLTLTSGTQGLTGIEQPSIAMSLMSRFAGVAQLIDFSDVPVKHLVAIYETAQGTQARRPNPEMRAIAERVREAMRELAKLDQTIEPQYANILKPVEVATKGSRKLAQEPVEKVGELQIQEVVTQ